MSKTQSSVSAIIYYWIRNMIAADHWWHQKCICHVTIQNDIDWEHLRRWHVSFVYEAHQNCSFLAVLFPSCHLVWVVVTLLLFLPSSYVLLLFLLPPCQRNNWASQLGEFSPKLMGLSHVFPRACPFKRPFLYPNKTSKTTCIRSIIKATRLESPVLATFQQSTGKCWKMVCLHDKRQGKSWVGRFPPNRWKEKKWNIFWKTCQKEQQPFPAILSFAYGHHTSLPRRKFCPCTIYLSFMTTYYQLNLISSKVEKLNPQMNMGVSKNNGTPKMDGENNGKPYEQIHDLGGPPLFLG